MLTPRSHNSPAIARSTDPCNRDWWILHKLPVATFFPLAHRGPVFLIIRTLFQRDSHFLLLSRNINTVHGVLQKCIAAENIR